MKVGSALFKLCIICLVCYGLYKEVFHKGWIAMGAFAYFTIQSNFLVAITSIKFLFSTKQTRGRCLLRGISLFAITITFIVYNFFIYHIFQQWGSPAYSISRTIFHVVVPVLFLLDWLLFDQHAQMRWKDVGIWLIYPLLYYGASVYVVIKYQYALYFFLDPSAGYGRGIRWAVVLLGLLILLGVVVVLVDRWLLGGRVNARNEGEIQKG